MRLIAASDDLTAEQQDEARGFLAAPPAVELDEVRELPAAAREGVYRAALEIVRLDRKVTEDEKQFLSRLRAALNLDEATIKDIEASH